MKNILSKYARYQILACLLIIASTYMGCKKSVGGPVVTEIKNYAASPNDTVLHRVQPGTWIVIIGSNLSTTKYIIFDGVSAPLDKVLFSDTSMVIYVPLDVYQATPPANLLNTIEVVTNYGSTIYHIPIGEQGPVVTAISNENANPGDSVIVTGYNLYNIGGITFAGINITNFTSVTIGQSSTLRFQLPASLPQSGPLVIVTQGGTITTLYNMNDVETGMLCNFDDVNTYAWGATAIVNSTSLFPDGRGRCAQMNPLLITAGDYSWYNGGKSVNLSTKKWITGADTLLPVSSFALKFETNVIQPWSSGTIYVSTNENNGLYTASYAPWNTPTGDINYLSNGWKTVTLPFTSFLTSANGVQGTGNPPTKLRDLLDSAYEGAASIRFENNGSINILNFDAAFDNIRVVRIQ